MDLISRQDAIDAHCELCADKDTCSGDICPDVEVFQLLPSVQPDLSGYSDRLWKAAYERGKAEAQLEPSQVARDIATIIENEQDMRVILSHQPEVIRCKDCKHHHRDNSGAYYCGRKEYGYGWGLNDFCSDAERRTDE